MFKSDLLRSSYRNNCGTTPPSLVLLLPKAGATIPLESSDKGNPCLSLALLVSSRYSYRKLPYFF